jgi:hypothetical protein
MRKQSRHHSHDRGWRYSDLDECRGFGKRRLVAQSHWQSQSHTVRRLPLLLLALCCALFSATTEADEQQRRDVMSAPYTVSLFDESVLADNVFAIGRQAAGLPDSERFELLAKWVLPTEFRPQFRMQSKFASIRKDVAQIEQAVAAMPQSFRHDFRNSPVPETVFVHSGQSMGVLLQRLEIHSNQ